MNQNDKLIDKINKLNKQIFYRTKEKRTCIESVKKRKYRHQLYKQKLNFHDVMPVINSFAPFIICLYSEPNVLTV